MERIANLQQEYPTIYFAIVLEPGQVSGVPARSILSPRFGHLEILSRSDFA